MPDTRIKTAPCRCEELLSLIESWNNGDASAGAQVVFNHFKDAIYNLSRSNFSPDKKRFANPVNSVIEGVARIKKSEELEVITEFCIYLVEKKAVLFRHIAVNIKMMNKNSGDTLTSHEIGNLVFLQRKWFRLAAIDFARHSIRKADKTLVAEDVFHDSIEASVGASGKSEPGEEKAGGYEVVIGFDRRDFLSQQQQLADGYEQVEWKRYKQLMAAGKECLESIEKDVTKAVLMALWLDRFEITPDDFRKVIDVDAGFEERYSRLMDKIRETHRRKKQEENKHFIVYDVTETDIHELFKLPSKEDARNKIKVANRCLENWQITRKRAEITVEKLLNKIR